MVVRHAILAVLIVAALVTPAAAQQANPQATALADFQQRLEDYLKLREKISGELKPLSKTASPTELALRQEQLAAGLREARQGAIPGDLITPRVATQIRNVVAADFRRRQPSAKRAITEEIPVNIHPGINKTMPDSAALATVPPLLLADLPRLPDNLQYRFMGRHVVLLDGDARIILDYVLNVLPAQRGES